MPRKELLSFEEITHLATVFAGVGVRKLRLTGGEPLLRKDLPHLIHMLAGVEGIEDIALTSNGFFLARHAKALKQAGLHRVTLSLDSLDEATFAAINGKAVAPKHVLDAIDVAVGEGLPVKINCVVQKGINDHEVLDLAAYFKERGLPMRFIEFMDVGNVNGWNMERVMPAREILARIKAVFPCEPVDADFPGEVARRYRYLDGSGEFGLITSVTQPFCGACNRARISADGELFTCLFAGKGRDLKTALREEQPEAVKTLIHKIWSCREDRYSEIRGENKAGADKVEMFKIGG